MFNLLRPICVELKEEIIESYNSHEYQWMFKNILKRTGEQVSILDGHQGMLEKSPKP